MAFRLLKMPFPCGNGLQASWPMNLGIDLHSLYSDLDAVQRRQDEMQNLLSSAHRLLQDRAIRPLRP